MPLTFKVFYLPQKNVTSFCFCIYVPGGALQHLISSVPNQKVTWSTFALLLHFFSPMGHRKSNTNPILNLIQLWESNEIIFESALKIIKHCENIGIVSGIRIRTFFSLYYCSLHPWKVITLNCILTTSDVYSSLKIYTRLRASFRKTIAINGLLYLQFQR